jgi:CheY-like chemotaxis protein
VFGIVEQNGGTIWTSSEIGKGTTFEVYLPRTDAASDGAVVARAESAARGGETILVVEDEDAVRRTVVRALGRKGYRVIETRNGREALEACDHRVGEIDLVLTDVMMPVMGGGRAGEAVAGEAPDAAGAVHVGLHRRLDPRGRDHRAGDGDPEAAQPRAADAQDPHGPRHPVTRSAGTREDARRRAGTRTGDTRCPPSRKPEASHTAIQREVIAGTTGAACRLFRPVQKRATARGRVSSDQ